MQMPNLYGFNMLFYLYFLISRIAIVIFFLIRAFVLRRNNISVELFLNALRTENNGQFEDAVTTYEKALNEVNKMKFHGRLKNKIVEKIKVLHTIIEYNNGIRYTRR